MRLSTNPTSRRLYRSFSQTFNPPSSSNSSNSSSTNTEPTKYLTYGSQLELHTLPEMYNRCKICTLTINKHQITRNKNSETYDINTLFTNQYFPPMPGAQHVTCNL